MSNTSPDPAAGTRRPRAEVLVARQPILDRNRDTAACELRYRSAGAGRAGFGDGQHATAPVITGSYMDIGIARIAHRRPAFINVTRGFLVSRAALVLRCVLDCERGDFEAVQSRPMTLTMPAIAALCAQSSSWADGALAAAA